MKKLDMMTIEVYEKQSRASKVDSNIDTEAERRTAGHAPHEIIGYLVGYEEFIDYASGENHWDHVSKMVFSEKAALGWLKANPRASEYNEQWTNGFYAIVFWDGTIGHRIYADANGEVDTKRR